MTIEQKNGRKATGQFAKGTSGNPSGRPAGSRNQATLLMEALLEGEGEQLTQKAIELAKAGDIRALGLCLDRLLPPRKDRSISLSLPSIENAQQLSSAISTVVGAVGDGHITPGEGEILANILAVQANVLTIGDIERRVEQLEQTMSSDKKESDNNDQLATDLAQRLREGRSAQVVDHDQ